MLERETGFEPATICLGSPDVVSPVARTWKGERDSHGQARWMMTSSLRVNNGTRRCVRLRLRWCLT